MDALSTTLKPRVSEKAYMLSQLRNVYVFDVPMNASKPSIKAAVQKQYEVEVTDVHIVIAKGKSVQSYRKRGRAITGKRNDVKKAYVTLKEGSSLPIFGSIEEEKK